MIDEHHEVKPTFYVAGGTLRTDAPSYVVRAADQQLYEALRDGEFAYVLTARQMGKSSLMVRVAKRLRAEGCRVVIVDLTALGQNLSADQWYYGFAETIVEQSGLQARDLEVLWEQQHWSPLQRWRAALEWIIARNPELRLVIFVDEIDIVQSLPFSTDELFAAIRELCNRRATEPNLVALTFCLLGVAAPSDLVRDVRITPFNIGERIELTDFTESEAFPLAKELGNPEVRNERLRRVLYWTAGHPYLTQRLCQAIAASSNGASVDMLCDTIFLSSPARHREDNLLFVRERLLRCRSDLEGLLSLYARVLKNRRVPDDDSNPLVGELRLAGICRAHLGALQIRNRVYKRVFNRTWVRDTMPDAERRRQRAAYMRGFALATALAAVALATIGWLAYAVVRQRDENRGQLYVADIGLAQQSLTQHDPHRAMKSLERHIPAHGESDLRGFEWYSLWRLCHDASPLVTIDVHSVYAALSSDGRRIFVSTAQNEIVEYDAATGSRLIVLAHVAKPVRSLAVSSSDHLIAEEDAQRNITLRDTDTGAPIMLLPIPASAGKPSVYDKMMFSVKGKLLERSNGSLVSVWRSPKWKPPIVYRMPGAEDVRFIAISPDEKYVACANRDTLEVWTADFRRRVATFTVNQPSDGSFSSDGNSIAFGDYGAIRIVNIHTRSERRLLGHRGWTGVSGFSADGRRLMSGGSDKTIRIWDMATDRQLLVFHPNPDKLWGTSLFPDGRRLLTWGTEGGGLAVWDLAEPAAPMTTSDEVYTINFSPDSHRLASGGNDGDIVFWDAATRTRTGVLHIGQRIEKLAYVNARELLGVSTHRAAVLDIDSGKTTQLLAESREGVMACLTPDRNRAAVAGKDGVRVIDLTTHRIVASHAFQEIPTAMAFAPDGRTLAITFPSRVMVWPSSEDFIRLSLPQTLPRAVRCVSFSPQGDRLLAGSDDSRIYVWDWRRKRLTAVLDAHRGPMKSLQFSPDGRRLVSAADDGTVILWDATTLRPLITYDESDRGMETAVFSPDGRYLATSGDDHIIRLRDGSPNR